jgi:hypothetical protein
MASRSRWIVFQFIVVVLFYSHIQARIIYVNNDGSADFNNIQAAIDDANNGDVVIVKPGIYTGDGNRDIDFKGKAITVRSTEPNDANIVAATIIDCNGTETDPHRGFLFCRYEKTDSILAGLTVTNGYTWLGGGIGCKGHQKSDKVAKPLITNCILRANKGSSVGGGVHVGYCAEPVIVSCILTSNVAERGGAIGCEGNGGKVSSCTIVDNLASLSGGGIDVAKGTLQVSHSILWGNRAGEGPQLSVGYTENSSNANVSYCDVEGGQAAIYVGRRCVLTWEGWNIDVDPCFVNSESGDYHLAVDSPCIEAGDSAYNPGIYDTDIDGETRLQGVRIDIGADESSFVAASPLIGYSSEQVQFAANISGHAACEVALYIRNRGTSTLKWIANTECPWLCFYPRTGVSVGDICEVNLHIDTTDLLVGQYDCELQITAEVVPNSPVTIRVKLHLSDRELHVPAEYATIQEAIDATSKADIIVISDGVYNGEGNRDIDFRGKSITVRSENGPSKCIIDCNGVEQEPHQGFIFHSGEESDSVLDGVTIMNGYNGLGGGISCDEAGPTIRNCTIMGSTASDWVDGGYGGGICCTYSNTIVSDCMIIDNSAIGLPAHAIIGGAGGGIYCYKSNLTVAGCIFENNEQWAHRGSGAIHCQDSEVRVSNCVFRRNMMGSIHARGGTLSIERCLCIGEHGDRSTGVACSYDCLATIIGCEIVGHKWCGIQCEGGDSLIIGCLIAGNHGGGIYSLYSHRSNFTIHGCTIVGNAGYASGCGGLYFDAGSVCTIGGSIVWNNRPLSRQIALHGYPATPSVCRIVCSDIQGWQEAVYVGSKCSLEWDVGNINLEPRFADSGYWDPNGTDWTDRDDFWVDGDYHLKSQAGRWDPTKQTWIVDDVTSPCIDAGDPNSPIGHEPFPNGGRINMGAYGGTAEASKSYFGGPVCETIVAGDINGDCKVDFRDFAIMAGQWLKY